MNASISSAAEKSLPADSEVERHSQLETDAERIRASVARLTANSIDGLEGLTSELQQLQKFLKSEVERVQGEIASALEGINIIVETIAPWKSAVSLAAPTPARPGRPGPAASVEAAQPRR